MLKKIIKIFGIIFGLFVALLIVAAVFMPDKAPESQLAFTKQLNEFRSSIKSATESGNSIHVDSLQSQFDAFINKERHVEFWHASVQSVDKREYGIRIEARYSDGQHDSNNRRYTQIYYLGINDAAGSIKQLSQLKKGDDIFFSGLLGQEMSVTNSGSIEQPEFHFFPESIKLSLDGSILSL
ncbi:MAG: hypothetical protein ACRCSE_09975 [Vibrio sp.]